LCRDLANGELDVALVSSFEFLRNPIYSIIDEISIASDGPVYSVIVAHREPLEVVAEIAIDPASEKSVNLLRALLAERGLTPQLVCEKASDSSRARLLIGDQAIRFREEHNDFAYWDLGDEWRHFCQRPFVYALWLIRPEFLQSAGNRRRLRAVRDRNLGTNRRVIRKRTEIRPAILRPLLPRSSPIYFWKEREGRFADVSGALRKTPIIGGSAAATHSRLIGELRIGITGWRYAGWRGKSYPVNLPQRRELEFAGSTFRPHDDTRLYVSGDNDSAPRMVGRTNSCAGAKDVTFRFF
jgi:chorismate dehydratase